MRPRIILFLGVLLVGILILVSGETRYRLSASALRLAQSTRCAVIPENFPSVPSAAPSPDAPIVARVFAAYPFNNSASLAVDRGAGQRVRVMMPAMLGDVLIGQVVEVSKEHSVVRLVGSPDWEIPVRIGQAKIPGLLQGGPTIRIAMIGGDKHIAPHDRIISASKELPYGLLIGTVESAYPDSSGGIFQEAVVRIPYVSADLTEIAIMQWTPDF